MKKVYSLLGLVGIVLSTAACNKVILKADFDADQTGSAPNMTLPGSPDGDSMQESNSQVRVIPSGPLASHALEFKKPEGMASRYVDFIATDGEHDSGIITIQFTFVREATGTDTSSYMFSVLSKEGHRLVSVALESIHAEAAAQNSSLTGSVINVIHGTEDGKTAVTRLGDYTTENITCTIKLNLDNSTFDVSFDGNSAAMLDPSTGYQFQSSLSNQYFPLKREGLDFKTLRVKVDSKDVRPGNIAIDNVKVWKKSS